MLTCFFRNISASITLPAPVQDYLKNSHIGEDGSLPSRQGARWMFEGYLKNNWREVLNDLNTITPTNNEKCKIVIGCEQKTEELFARGQIDMVVVEKVLAPSAARSGFLAANWQHPAVRSLMDKFRNLIPANNYLKSYPDAVLSGKAKKDLDEMNRNYGENGPTPLPFSSLGNPVEQAAAATPSLATPTPSKNTSLDAASASPAIGGSPSEINFPILSPAYKFKALLFSLTGIALFALGLFVFKNRR